MSAPTPILRCAGQSLDLSRPQVMGVLNVTPDSFSDGGRYASLEAAVAHGVRLAAEGAALIDVGGESTRPGAEPVSVAEELARVVPVIQRLRAATAAIVSVDTSKPEVMREAARAGAGLINDVRALREPGALEAARDSGCAVCLMHMQGQPRTMQHAPSYGDVVAEVRAFLAERLAAARAAGLAADQIVVDPGFGFGKSMAHNLTLLHRLREIASLEVPVLVGLSRKSLIGTLTGRTGSGRIHGSIALAALAVAAGARIVRAHDVAATVDALKVTAAVIGGG
jgi:dihydropteroate synthase